MERKIKFILIGLIAVSVVFIFLFVAALSSKQQVLRERDDLKKENASLTSQMDKVQIKLRDSENKITSLNNELDKFVQELDKTNKAKQDIENKYNLAVKEREQLIEKLKAKPKEVVKEVVKEVPAKSEESAPTDAYWAGILKDKKDLEMKLEKLGNELKDVQINNEQLQREKSTQEIDLKALKREAEDLKRQIDYNQKLMDSIAQELVREKNDKNKIMDSFKEIKTENAVLLRQIKSLNNRKVTLERKLQTVREDRDVFERRLNEMETMLTDRVSQVGELKEQLDAIRSGKKIEAPEARQKKESVELPPIVVRPASETSQQQEMATSGGKILAINKDSNFVIIDAGEDAGIKVGDVFQVYRGDRSVATIEVIQTRKNISACDIKKESSPINIGDVITR
jgi:chromosome segregation ATPase